MKQLILVCVVYLGLCFAQLPESLVNEAKCDKLGGPGTYDKLKAADAESKACIRELFDSSTIRNEIYKEDGSNSNKLGRFDNKGPQVNGCIKNKMELIKLCLTKDEKRRYNTVIGILRTVADYVYENDGERVITFVEKGGIECLKSRLEEVRSCFGDNPLTLLDSQVDTCNDYDNIKNCVVRELGTYCSSSIPANITDDVLRFARSSICSNNKIIRSRRGLRRVARGIAMGDRLPHIKKSLLKACEKVETNLNETMDKLETCVNEKKMFITPKDEFISHMDACSRPVIKKLEGCLPEKLHYFPKFLFVLVESVVGLLYDDFKEIALGLGPCMSKLKSEESEKDYNSCIHNLTLDNDDNIPESKAAFCAKFLPVTNCFTKQIKDTCETNPDLEKFTKDWKKAMAKPCA